MPLQKRRLGRTRIHHRRSAWMRLAQNSPATQKCANCQEPKLPHRVCAACGQYKGNQIMVATNTEGEE